MNIPDIGGVLTIVRKGDAPFVPSLKRRVESVAEAQRVTEDQIRMPNSRPVVTVTYTPDTFSIWSDGWVA